MPLITCIEDLRLLARRPVPRMFYDYADSGSWTESTYRANERELAALCFRQRVAVNIENRSIRSTMIGENVAMPVALGPTGLCGMQHADGEILAARAAEAFGIPFCLSTMSICSIEDVAANTIKPFWFQLYVMRNRDFVERLIGRANEAQCSALVVTLDLPLSGQRHKDLRNGLSVPPRLTIANLIDMVMKPPAETKLTQSKLVNKDINHANRINLVDPILQAFGKKRRLPAIRPLNEALHPIPHKSQKNHITEAVFTQPGPKADICPRINFAMERIALTHNGHSNTASSNQTALRAG
jgi:isopentenyl diphosphate isomerase/L-lactate dehydrogenase-like FMN-dependent dehydrogenase